MFEMGRGRFHRRVCADEAVRGQSYSRRHPQACLQNTSDEAGDVRAIDFCRDAFGVGLVAGAEAGLVPVRRGHLLCCNSYAGRIGEGGSTHVEAAVYVQDVSGDV
jgi:hypothetical protein